MKIATIPVVLNGASGSGHARADAERLQASFRQAGLEARVLTDADLAEVARRAMRDRPPVLVAGGGDGTLNAVAHVVRGTGTAPGVLPLRTLNHFAKDPGLPLQLDAAA